MVVAITFCLAFCHFYEPCMHGLWDLISFVICFVSVMLYGQHSYFPLLDLRLFFASYIGITSNTEF